MTLFGKIPFNSRLISVEIETEGEKIKSIKEIEDGNYPLILPGFIDVHTHGGGGMDVNHIESMEDVERLSSFYASHGVTSVQLSLVTDTEESMVKCLKVLGEAREKKLKGAQLVGIHLEGPFLSDEYKGSMPSELIVDPDPELFDRYFTASRGHISYITIAPERKGAMPFISSLRRKGVVVSMGHSSAEYETALEAIENGVTSATHLFNAMKLFHMHRPAISGASLESDQVYAEIISDGFHLHPGTVRLVLKTKGLDKVVAITDSIMAAGLPDGEYKLGVNDVVVKDGDAKLRNGVRAGSTLTLDKALRNLIKFTGLGPETLWRILSLNQANMMGLSDRGALEVGKRADMVVLSKENEVMKTIVGGEVVFEKEDK